jgi:hypothetical protein
VKDGDYFGSRREQESEKGKAAQTDEQSPRTGSVGARPLHNAGMCIIKHGFDRMNRPVKKGTGTSRIRMNSGHSAK